MSKFEYTHLSYHFKITSQESDMNVTPASVERVQKCVFNFEIYTFLKKKSFTPFSPTAITQRARVTCLVIDKIEAMRDFVTKLALRTRMLGSV